MRESLAPIQSSWPKPSSFALSDADDLSTRWIANLFPPLEDLLMAHQDAVHSLLGRTAAERGFSRWGAKFVRLGAEDAEYLKLLFPEAVLVFLVRNPIDAWASYRHLGLRSYVRWDDDPVVTVRRFGRLWSERVGGFRRSAESLEAVMLRFEDLTNPSPAVDSLEMAIGATIDRSTLLQKIGANTVKRPNRVERLILARTCGSEASKLGYDLS